MKTLFVSLVLASACATASPQPLPLTSVEMQPRAGAFDAPRAHALLLWHQARDLELMGRCDEAAIAYTRYADYVRPMDARSAELAAKYSGLCPPRAELDAALSEALVAIHGGRPREALALLDADTHESPWRDYARGVALADLRRAGDAARAFDDAAHGFGPDVNHRAMAIYGKARAYHDALQCVDATAAYEQYAALVGGAEAERAYRYARDCSGL